MRALVLGATGHLGQAFTRELLARGWAVSGASRRAGRSPLLAELPARRLSGDWAKPGQLAEWIRGHDLVVDAAAPQALRLGDEALGCDAERRMRALLEGVAAERAQLIFVSSFTTLERPRSFLGGAQAALFSALHPYFELKRVMEARVRAAARAGLECVIVNPTYCLGPFESRPPEQCLVPLVLSGRLPATHGHTVNVIDTRDVAAASLAALEQRCFDEPIPLSGHNTTLEVLVAMIARLGGVTPPRHRAPLRLVAAAAYANEVIGALTALPPAAHSLSLLLALEQRWEAPGARQRSLGTHLRPLARTVADAIAWYAAHGSLGQLRDGRSRRSPRASGEG